MLTNHTLEISPTNGKLIIRIDASALKDSSCLLRFFRTVVQGYTSPKTYNDMEYGSAFHAFVENLIVTGDVSLSLYHGTQYFLKRKASSDFSIKPKKTFLNEHHLSVVCNRYYEEVYKHDDFQCLVDEATGTRLTEQKFAIPYYSTDKVEVLLCGTIDRIGQIRGGCHCIGDFKTTSVWNVDEYFRGYELSPQLMLYKMVLSRLGQAGEPGNLFEKFFQQRVGCFIDGIFLKPEPDKVAFKRSKMIWFDDVRIDEFEKMLYTAVYRLVDALEASPQPLREGMLNGSCQTVYGLCKFFNVCSAPDERARDMMLQNFFSRRNYNPMMFGGGDKGEAAK
jgi:hypothetical protein